MSMAKKDVENALRRVHYLRVLNRINRITALIRRGSVLLSLFVMAVNVVGIVRSVGRMQ